MIHIWNLNFVFIFLYRPTFLMIVYNDKIYINIYILPNITTILQLLLLAARNHPNISNLQIKEQQNVKVRSSAPCMSSCVSIFNVFSIVHAFMRSRWSKATYMCHLLFGISFIEIPIDRNHTQQALAVYHNWLIELFNIKSI